MTPPTHEDLVEISLASARDNRLHHARWLAAEILLSDPVALADPELENRLHYLQDNLEEQTRIKFGLPTAKPLPLTDDIVKHLTPDDHGHLAAPPGSRTETLPERPEKTEHQPGEY